MEQFRFDGNFKSAKYGEWSIHSVAMFMMAVYIVLSSTFEFLEGYGFLNSVSLYAFLGLGGLNIIYKKKVVFMKNYYFIAVLLYFAMLTVSRFYAPEEVNRYINWYYYRFFTMVVICFITINLIETKEDMTYLMNAFVISGLITVIFFVTSYGEQIFSLADQVSEAERLGQDFGNVNLVAQRLAFSLILSLYLLIFKAERGKFFYFLVTISCMAVILLTGSRKSLLVIVVLGLFMFYQYAKGKSLNFKIWSLIIMVLAIAVLTYVIINVPMFSSIKLRMETTVRTFLGTADRYEARSDANRMRYVSTGLRYWLKHPFLGNGMTFSYYIFRTYSHNNYIELLLNTGIIGFGIYYYPFVRTFLYSVSKKVKFEKPFKILVACIVLAIAVIDIGVVSYYDRYICLLMSAITSVLIAENSDSKADEE